MQLSENTKAILLLTAPLISGKGRRTDQPLTLGAYNRLAGHLHEIEKEPADLLRTGADDLLRDCPHKLNPDGIKRLLSRGVQLAAVNDQWESIDIWVVSRADDEYPARLRRLSTSAPPVLYGCGPRSLLENRGLAVVGSRNVGEDPLEFSRTIGRLAAESEYTIVSGAAKGVDQAAMSGALEHGGMAVGVVTGDLRRSVLNRENRQFLVDEQLVLVSPNDPEAGFNVGKAMERNKLIYALADAALVVESTNGSGGTWNGAIEQLEKNKKLDSKGRYVPVFTRSAGDISPGLEGLLKQGAIPWPEPANDDEFRDTMRKMANKADIVPTKPELFPQPGLEQRVVATVQDAAGYEPIQSTTQIPSDEAHSIDQASPADSFFVHVEKLIETLESPVTEAAVVEHLGVSGGQARVWLGRLADEGKYARKTRPVRYIRAHVSIQAILDSAN